MAGKERHAAGTEPAIRLDKWLWAARFFKTRSLAAKAVSGGQVHVNGNRAKPARQVAVGDELEIHRGGWTFVVEVRALSGRRGPATVARTLYEETAASEAARARQREERRLTAGAPVGPRPSKRDRRLIRKFTRRGG